MGMKCRLEHYLEQLDSFSVDTTRAEFSYAFKLGTRLLSLTEQDLADMFFVNKWAIGMWKDGFAQPRLAKRKYVVYRLAEIARERLYGVMMGAEEPSLASLLAKKTERAKVAAEVLRTEKLIRHFKDQAWASSDQGASSVRINPGYVNKELIAWAKENGIEHSYDDGSPEEGNMAGQAMHTFSWANAGGCKNNCDGCECGK